MNYKDGEAMDLNHIAEVIKAGDKIPAKKLNAAAKESGKLGQRARLAKTLRGMA